MRGCKQTCSIHAAAQKIDAAPKSGSRTNSPPSTAANNELLHTQRPPTLLTRSFNITRPAPPRLASLPPCKQTLHYQLPLPVSRHKILQLVWDDVSVNLVDGSWATEIGFALEFRFPAHGNSSEVVNTPLPERARNGKLDLRQNLFDALYVTPASPSCFLDGQPASDPSHARLRAARVFPALPASRVLLSSADSQACDDVPASTLQPPVQRLRGDSRTGGGQEDFEREVEWFKTTYDEDMSFWDEANSGKTRAGTRRVLSPADKFPTLVHVAIHNGACQRRRDITARGTAEPLARPSRPVAPRAHQPRLSPNKVRRPARRAGALPRRRPDPPAVT